MKLIVGLATWRKWMWPEVIRQLNAQTVMPDVVCILPPTINDAAYRFAGQLKCPSMIFERTTQLNWAESFVESICKVMDGWLISWADDDCYGTNYIEQVRDTINKHPDAWMIGRDRCPTEWIGGRRDGQSEEWIDPPNFAATSICYPIWLRAKYPEFRIPISEQGISDGFFLNEIARKIWQRENAGNPPFYSHNGEFILRRYADLNHKHEWNDSRDKA